MNSEQLSFTGLSLDEPPIDLNSIAKHIAQHAKYLPNPEFSDTRQRWNEEIGGIPRASTIARIVIEDCRRILASKE